MEFTKELVNELADKLLIGLTEEENKMVLDEFKEIDENINLINNISNIENQIPMTYALDDFSYELRDDVASSSLDINDLLKNCDESTGREIEIPKVVRDE